MLACGQMVNGLEGRRKRRGHGDRTCASEGNNGEGTMGAFETTQHYQRRGHMSVACNDSVSYHFFLQRKHLSSQVPNALGHMSVPSVPEQRQAARPTGLVYTFRET